jgi:hypothetical protein
MTWIFWEYILKQKAALLYAKNKHDDVPIRIDNMIDRCKINIHEQERDEWDERKG